MRPLLPARRLPILWLAVAAAAALSIWTLVFNPLPPAHGEPAIGVAYRVELSCPEGFELGDWLWRFDDVSQWPPPSDLNHRWMPRDPAPGVLTVTTATMGTFVADSNKVEYPIVRDRLTNGTNFLCPGV
jgi:hypothetical protein